MTPNPSSAVQLTPQRHRKKEPVNRVRKMRSQTLTRIPERSADGTRRTVVARRPRLAASVIPWRILPAGNRSRFYRTVKRTLDVVGATGMLIVLSPMLLIVAAILFLTTRGHPIFVQERVGYLGRPFRLYKFRTMVLNAEALQEAVGNQKDGPIFKNDADPRITTFGKIFRRTSIDELPQLFNVLKGDMSLTGPRPPLAKEVAEYEPWHCMRLSVKPGLTCLWQISGRSEIMFHRWMLMDLWYVRHQNLWVDSMLLLRTPWAVLSRRGAY